MNRFSPKIEIINHFDDLINRVDIEIEKCLEKFKEDELLSQCKTYVKQWRYSSIYSSKNDNKIHDTVDLWSESTKVVDYLNQVRMRTIEELRKEQNDALEYYKLNSSNFQNQLKEGIKIEELKSQLFGEKFYFQVLYKPSDHKSWIFNLFTIWVDFYMSPNDIDLLEKMLNYTDDDIKKFFKESKCILDEKMVLINLIFTKIEEYIKTEKFPNQSICFRKEDILDIVSICFYYGFNGISLTSSTNYSLTYLDLSKLEKLHIYNLPNMEEIKIEDLSSLKYLSLEIDSVERVTLRNLFALREFDLVLKQQETAINSDILDKFLDILPYIENLNLSGYFSNFNLDNLVRLNKLCLMGKIHTEEFNFDLFTNLCSQLTKLEIYIENFDDNCLEKLLYGLHYPNLVDLRIDSSRITKLEKRFFDGLQMLQNLIICKNRELRKINIDLFSNLKQLRNLELIFNRIESLEKGHFSELINLESLSLCGNQLKTIENEENLFLNLNNLTKLDLSHNRIHNLNSELYSFILGLQNLKELNLNSSQLRDFNFRILYNMNTIEKVYLKGNLMSNKDEILSCFSDSKIKFYF